MRVASDDAIINIRGVYIPSNLNSPYCIKHRNNQDLRKLTSEKNGYVLTLSYLEDALIKEKDHKSSVYWLFDTTADKASIETYEQANKLTPHDIIKHTLSQLYDELVNMIYSEVLEKVNKYKK